jgi:hypothetical protein
MISQPIHSTKTRQTTLLTSASRDEAICAIGFDGQIYLHRFDAANMPDRPSCIASIFCETRLSFTGSPKRPGVPRRLALGRKQLYATCDISNLAYPTILSLLKPKFDKSKPVEFPGE